MGMMATTLNPKERNMCMECAEEKHLNNEEIKKEFENLKHWKALLLEVDESIVEDLKKREWKFIEKSINSTREEAVEEIEKIIVSAKYEDLAVGKLNQGEKIVFGGFKLYLKHRLSKPVKETKLQKCDECRQFLANKPHNCTPLKQNDEPVKEEK